MWSFASCSLTPCFPNSVHVLKVECPCFNIQLVHISMDVVINIKAVNIIVKKKRKKHCISDASTKNTGSGVNNILDAATTVSWLPRNKNGNLI